MNVALAWLRTQFHGKHTVGCLYVDGFPDLEACLRDPNRYIDQKFTDWVIARDSRDPPDYFPDMQEANFGNAMSEPHSCANRMRSTNLNYSESYLDGTNQTVDMVLRSNTRENNNHRNNFLDEVNSNLDENGSEIKAIKDRERVDNKRSQRRSRKSRNFKCKKSNTCIRKPKHQFLEVLPKGVRSFQSSKMPLREIQDDPYRRHIEESSSPSSPPSTPLSEKSETAGAASKFTFNISVFRCPVTGCGKLYRRRSHLQSHTRRHTGERPFPCTWDGCNWRFSRSDELVRHMRSHSGDKPFVCTTCSKRFARSDHLKKHLRVHQKALIGYTKS